MPSARKHSQALCSRTTIPTPSCRPRTSQVIAAAAPICCAPPATACPPPPQASIAASTTTPSTQGSSVCRACRPQAVRTPAGPPGRNPNSISMWQADACSSCWWYAASFVNWSRSTTSRVTTCASRRSTRSPGSDSRRTLH